MLYLVVKTVEAYVEAADANAARDVVESMRFDETGADVDFAISPACAASIPKVWLKSLPFCGAEDAADQRPICERLEAASKESDKARS